MILLTELFLDPLCPDLKFKSVKYHHTECIFECKDDLFLVID